MRHCRIQMIEDKLLIWKFKRGSSDALSRIYEKYKNSLLKIVFGLLNETAAAEDIVHDCFVSLAQSPEKLRVNGNLKSYLATCVANRVRNTNLARQRKATSGLNDGDPALFVGLLHRCVRHQTKSTGAHFARPFLCAFFRPRSSQRPMRSLWLIFLLFYAQPLIWRTSRINSRLRCSKLSKNCKRLQFYLSELIIVSMCFMNASALEIQGRTSDSSK